jgi:hypothetical protein
VAFDFNTPVTDQSKDEWLTPPDIIKALGDFDLDPCAPIERPWNMARNHYNRLDDGLGKPWRGRIWCNPPYGGETFRWVQHLADHGDGIALTKKQMVVTAPKAGNLRMDVLGFSTDHQVLDASGKQVDEFTAHKRDVSLQPGIYSVKFGNGLWTSIEVRPGETTVIKPGYLKVEPLSATAVDVLEPETHEKVDELYSTRATTTLIPGRFMLKMGNVMWPEEIEVKPGETTIVRPGTIRVESHLRFLRPSRASFSASFQRGRNSCVAASRCLPRKVPNSSSALRHHERWPSAPRS